MGGKNTLSLWKKRLGASTLVEAVVALALLATITTIVFLVINNINRRSNVGLKVRAFNEVNGIYNLSLLEEEYGDKTYDFKSFYVVRKSEVSEHSEKLIDFSVTAFYTNGPQIARKQQLVRLNGYGLKDEKDF
ncbi:MAG: hypothetical protein KBA50_03075 [Sedimentibacter sp.]|nr:hypothetical protein [Sedimentibacter sp.]